MENIIEVYKGFAICKPKPDAYMKKNNITYLVYDSKEDLFDGAKTLEEARGKIDCKIE